MKKFQKTIAVIMSVATAISAVSFTSFAAEDQPSVTGGAAVEGSGTFEGTVEKVKYNMILPTTPAVGFYDFILDPQSLIEKTGADRFGGSYNADSFADGKYLFFKNTDSSGNVTYSDSSDVLTAYNLSNKAVKLTVDGTVTGGDGLTFTSGTPNEGLNINLSITDDTGASPAYFATTDGGAITAKYEAPLAAVDESCFDVVWKDSKYEYGYKSTFADKITAAAGDYSTITEATKASFKLVGAIAQDEDGDKWENYTGQPKVSIVWSMADPDFNKAPSLANTSITVNETGHIISFDLGSGDSAATGLAATNAVQYKLVGSNEFKTLSANYTYSNGTLTLNEKGAQVLKAGSQIKVKFNDAAGTVITIDFVE